MIKKKIKDKIEVPQDWYQLVDKTSRKFKVNEMDQNEFLDFGEVLKKQLVYRKQNVKKEPWKFENIQWIRVRKDAPGTFFYKCSFEDEEPFKTVSLVRKNKSPNISLEIHHAYPHGRQNTITVEKKNDLLQLLKFLKPSNHIFFQNLKTE